MTRDVLAGPRAKLPGFRFPAAQYLGEQDFVPADRLDEGTVAAIADDRFPWFPVTSEPHECPEVEPQRVPKSVALAQVVDGLFAETEDELRRRVRVGAMTAKERKRAGIVDSAVACREMGDASMIVLVERWAQP